MQRSGALSHLATRPAAPLTRFDLRLAEHESLRVPGTAGGGAG
jgi:hypothetical protein